MEFTDIYRLIGSVSEVVYSFKKERTFSWNIATLYNKSSSI